MKIKISSRKVTGGLSEPVYEVTSALELLDRLMRCRSKERITEISIKLGGRDNWYTLAWSPAPSKAWERIHQDRMGDPEYVEQLAVGCFNRAIKFLYGEKGNVGTGMA